MKYSYFLEQCYRYWKTTMHQNVFPTNFHTQNILNHVWKTVNTKLQCIVVLQSRGEVMKNRRKNDWTNLVRSFSRFLDILPAAREHQNIKLQFQQFSMYGDKYAVCGKLSELPFSASLSSNCRETVPECITITWYQDLRVQHMH